MSSRSNKKRKPRKDHTNRERTVTTLTGAPNTEYLVPIPSEEPPIFNPNAKMQGTMAPPYPVQHSPSFQYHSGRPPGANTTGYAAFDNMNTMQHVQSQQSSVYGPAGTQHHQQPGGQATTASGRSQEAKPTPRLPPGKNDLEILENLKRIIKEGQHPFFRAVPQPAALASLYKGVIPISDSKGGDTTEKPSTTAAPKDSEPVQTTSSTTAAENGASAGSGAKAGSNDGDRYSPGSQHLRELSLSANGTNGPGAPPTSAGSTQDSHRDNGPPPPSSAFSSASTNLPDEPHDEPYDPTRSREYYSAPNRPPRPDSVYERSPAGYPNKDYNGYDTKEPLPPRRAAWGGPPPPPRDFNNRSDHDQGYDSRPVSDSRATISFGPPPSFPHGVEFGGDGVPSQQRRPNDEPRKRNRRDQHLELVDPIIERSLHIPDLAPGQTDPAELRPLIEKAREEKRKIQLSQGDAAGAQGAGAAMTATESRPLPTGTMPTEGASTLRESEIPSAQRAAEAAAEGDDHDNDIRSSRASSGGTPRVTTFVIPASPPIIPIAGIDVPIPEKKPLPDAPNQDQPSSGNDNEDQPIKIERPPYGRQFYGSLPPGETALDIGALAPLFHEIQRQEEIRKNATASAAATPYAASSSSSTGRGAPPQEYPPAPESRRHTPQDNLPIDSGPPPAHPPARFERERYPRDIRDARDSRDASPASHAPRRYPPPSPPGSVRGVPHPPPDAPDRDRDRDWQYHQQHNYGRRERWGDHWDPSESYGRDYPPPPPRSSGWDPRDREYPPRDYPPGPPHLDDRDRSYAPPPPIDDRRDRPPPGPYNPPYGRVRHRSPSPPPPPRRPGGGPPDDLRPPAKRARDEYGDYYTPAPPPPARDLPPPHRRGAGDHYPPLAPPRTSSPHGPPSSWAPPPGGGPPGDRDRDRDRDMMRDRDMRGRDYRPGPMEYPPPPPHAHAHPHSHPHGHDAYARPRSPPHGPPPPGPARPYGRGGYGGRGDRYPPPRP
ncbi:hypothetical protein BJ165DRAFT_1525699 [Panaeolus papilionaceus]|nr:hypothetical protein BJ165DRAFT_1525699 [Panaeolus papilionaceus]